MKRYILICIASFTVSSLLQASSTYYYKNPITGKVEVRSRTPHYASYYD